MSKLDNSPADIVAKLEKLKRVASVDTIENFTSDDPMIIFIVRLNTRSRLKALFFEDFKMMMEFRLTSEISSLVPSEITTKIILAI